MQTGSGATIARLGLWFWHCMEMCGVYSRLACLALENMRLFCSVLFCCVVSIQILWDKVLDLFGLIFQTSVQTLGGYGPVRPRI